MRGEGAPCCYAPSVPRLPSAICFVVVLALPLGLSAQEATLCIDPDGGAAPSCCPDSGAEPFESVEAALGSIEGTPESLDRLTLCVGSNSPVSLPIVVDLASVEAEEVLVQFASPASPNWCPGQDGVRIQDTSGGSSRLSLQGFHYSPSECAEPTSPSPLLQATAVDFELDGARLLDVEGTVLEFSSGPDVAALVDVRRTRIEGGSGRAILGDGELRIDGSEFSARASDAPLVEVTAGRGILSLASTLFFGNAVVSEGVPLISSRAVVRAVFTTVSANSLARSGAVVEVDGRDGTDPVVLSWVESSISDTRFHNASSPSTAPSVPRPVVEIASSEFECLPAASDGLRPISRSRPQEPADIGAGELLRVTEFPGEWGLLRIQKSYFVRNLISAEGALLGVSGTSGRYLILLHNTIEEERAPIVRASSDVDESWLVSARNLLLGRPSLELGSRWALAETTMELIEGDPSGWIDGASQAASGLQGPFPPDLGEGSRSLFRGAAAEGLSDCERALAHCPEMAETDCSSGAIGPGFAQCGLDGAVEYLFTSAGQAVVSHRWPWVDSGFPQVESGAGENAPGASGWTCGAEVPEPYDFTGEDGPYDGDGATGMVDCDNFDAGIVPEVPEFDGFGEEPCEPAACYECPDEAVRPGEDPVPQGLVSPGCTRGNGCGTPLAFGWLLLPLLLQRRRQ